MLIVHLQLEICFNIGVLGPLNFKTVDLLITCMYILLGHIRQILMKSRSTCRLIRLTGPPMLKTWIHDRFLK